MANVVRFTLPTARELHVSGVGTFHAGVLDIPVTRADVVGRARYLLKPYGAVEVGTVPAGTALPTLPAAPGTVVVDPYPQYVTDADLDNPASGPMVKLKAAFVPFWKPSETVASGAVRMTALGLTITRNSSGTTRASYDATEAALWTATSGSGGSSTTDASLLTSGTLPAARIADGSLTAAKMAADVATQAELDAASTADRARANHTGTQPASTITGLDKPKAFMGRALDVVTSRWPCVHSQLQSDGVVTVGNFRHRMPIVRNGPYVVLMFVNWNGFSDTAAPNAITVRAAVEASGAQFAPVTFGGRRDVVIDPDGIVFSDPIPVQVALGDALFCRTRVTVAAGEKWPRNAAFDPGLGEGGLTGSDGADLTTSGTIATSFGYGYGPVSVLSNVQSATRPLIVGGEDSIMAGSNDAGVGSTTTTVDWGIGRRFAHLLNNPFVNSALGGARVNHVVSTTLTRGVRFRRLLAGQSAGAVYFGNGGTNDIHGGGRTTAQLANDVLTYSTWLAAAGARVIRGTITPQTTSTDSWATAGGQTVSAANPQRVGYNDWLRAGAPINSSTKQYVAPGTGGALTMGQAGHPIYGYVELADSAETARNSGIWIPGGTTDGVHPLESTLTSMVANALCFNASGQVTPSALFGV